MKHIWSWSYQFLLFSLLCKNITCTLNIGFCDTISIIILLTQYCLFITTILTTSILQYYHHYYINTIVSTIQSLRIDRIYNRCLYDQFNYHSNITNSRPKFIYSRFQFPFQGCRNCAGDSLAPMCLGQGLCQILSRVQESVVCLKSEFC